MAWLGYVLYTLLTLIITILFEIKLTVCCTLQVSCVCFVSFGWLERGKSVDSIEHTKKHSIKSLKC